ncbi:hypothetical protein ACFCX4_08915 [Kitasatospora sp. NPDC056327]|uniref:hypothetical protein n=1 Tax=Kitasatospora sp. NPDC056327 TaxID=3345785 RepID=UPI0035DE0E5A
MTGETYALRKAREAREAGDEKKAKYWEHIERTVAAMPPLTDDEIVKLRAIFNGANTPRRRTA